MDKRKLKRKVQRFYKTKNRHIYDSNLDPRKKFTFKIYPYILQIDSYYYHDIYIYCGKTVISTYSIKYDSFTLCDPIG